MCFSATASFATAGFLAVAGIISITRIQSRRELPLAAIPIIFAVQQAVEGVLWLDLAGAPEGPVAAGLVLLFLILAEVFWPVYVPVTMLVMERDEGRRRFLVPLLAIGAFVAADRLWNIASAPYGARILCGHVVYVAEYRFNIAMGLAYLAAVSLPLLMSTQRAVAVLGGIVLLGCLTSYLLYREAFVSVWCFFAAAASAVILSHFIQLHRAARLAPL